MTDRPDDSNDNRISANFNALIIERISPLAVLPFKAHDGDLGYDLYASETRTILPGMTCIVPTGLKIQFPNGWGAKIFDRSSVATKDNLLVVAGVIDNGYRGELKVALHNFNKEAFEIHAGKKIAQMLLIPVVNMSIYEGIVVDDTLRGAGGFGSTGV
jgi:dUTP pyrophosphatase